MSGTIAVGTMPAAVLTAHGDLDAVVVLEVPDPVPAPGEVRIRVDACGLNWIDVFLRRTPGLAGARLPVVLGIDVAGVVDAVGPGVAATRLGEPVLVYPFVTCGKCRFCSREEENICPERRFIGVHRDGGLARYVTVPERALVPQPAGIAPVDAAALPVAVMVAWHMLMNVGRLEEAETVVIFGASGGIGSASVQLARWRRARVVAVTSGPERAVAVRRLGADDVVDRLQVGWEEELAGRNADLVANPVGGEVLRTGVRALAPNGRLVVGGARAGRVAEVDVADLYHRQLRVLGSNGGTSADMRAALEVVGMGALQPLVADVVALEDVQAGYRLLESGDAIGKVVVSLT